MNTIVAVTCTRLVCLAAVSHHSPAYFCPSLVKSEPTWTCPVYSTDWSMDGKRNKQYFCCITLTDLTMGGKTWYFCGIILNHGWEKLINFPQKLINFAQFLSYEASMPLYLAVPFWWENLLYTIPIIWGQHASLFSGPFWWENLICTIPITWGRHASLSGDPLKVVKPWDGTAIMTITVKDIKQKQQLITELRRSSEVTCIHIKMVTLWMWLLL